MSNAVRPAPRAQLVHLVSGLLVIGRPRMSQEYVVVYDPLLFRATVENGEQRALLSEVAPYAKDGERTEHLVLEKSKVLFGPYPIEDEVVSIYEEALSNRDSFKADVAQVPVVESPFIKR